MEQMVLNTVERNEKPHISRKNGFVPGVIYGDDFKAGLPVKFNKSELLKLLLKHGVNAKVNVKLGGNQKLGVIKEIQKDPVSGAVLHVDVQAVSLNKDVRLHLPIIFHGRSKIEEHKLLLQVNLNEIDVSGRADIMPESVVVDVTEMRQGHVIHVSDIKLDDHMKLHNDKDEIVAVIGAWKESKVKAETAAPEAAAETEDAGEAKEKTQ